MQNYITADLTVDKSKKYNLFLLSIFYGFCWITFHFIIVYFFGLVLDSPLMIWIFLWVWNFVALLIDIPLWIFQKYFKQKSILLFGTAVMFVSSLIVLKFILFAWENGYITTNFSGIIEWESLFAKTKWVFDFLLSGTNWVLFSMVAIFYGVIKESYDVTFLSYIMNNTPPSNYADVISKYNISFGVWAMLWVVISWFILTLSITTAIGVLIGVIILFFILINILFDNDHLHFETSDIQKLNFNSIKNKASEKKDIILEKFDKSQLKNIASNTKYVFLKPLRTIWAIDTDDIIEATIEGFKSFRAVMFSQPRDYIVMITSMTILLFGFWDTFISTFQIDFLEKIIDLNQESLIIEQWWALMSGYVLLLLLVIPAFAMQRFFIVQQKNYTTLNLILAWIVISAVSIMGFGISNNILLVMMFGILNSVWYAAAMPLAIATFSERYNSEYAKIYDTQEIDSNSSAAPLKMLINIANVIWLVVWWALVWIIGFNGFFALFALCLMAVAIYNLTQTGKKN